LEAQVNALAHGGSAGVAYADVEFINAEGIVTRELELPQHQPSEVLRNLVVPGPVSTAAYSLLYNRSCIDEVGVYDEAQRYTQDADMLIRLARRFPLVRVPQKLIRIRQHENRASSDGRWVGAALEFYRGWLDRLSLEELFPELSGRASGLARAKARRWMGDAYARHGVPPYLNLAAAQYLSALGESPAILPSLTPRVAKLAQHYFRNNRQFYRLGLRSTLRRLLGD
jgi:hypothetical protein